MIAKFGLILLVLVFGALMLLVGLMAPDSIRRPLAGLGGRLQPPRVAAKLTSAPAPSATPAAKAADAQPQPIPYQALLIPSPLPPDGQYALQLGSYPTSSGAAASAKRAQDSGLPVSQIPVLDQNGERWFAVAVGQYSSPDDARAARISLSRTLELTQPLPVIRLPPKPSGGPTSQPGTDVSQPLQANSSSTGS